MISKTSLRAKALAFLARREHTRTELQRKLSPHAESNEELGALLDDLIARRLLSENRYAEARVHVLSRKFGTARIERDLRARGVSEDEVKAATKAIRTTDFERAQEVWRRKFGAIPRDMRERAKQARFLLARGFDAEIVKQVLSGTDE